MKRLSRLLSRDASFRTQLVTAFALGMLLLALLSSLTNALIANREFRARMVAQGQQITDTLARQSVLALLYGSGENARDAATSTLGFPDVRQVVLYDRQGAVLLDLGDGKARPAPHLQIGAPGSQTIQETEEAWHFFAPVFSHDAPIGIAEEALLYAVGEENKNERLGLVQISLSKGSLRQMERTVLANNVISALVSAALLLTILNLLLRRLLRPLNRLLASMRRVEERQEHIQVDVQGPKEVTHLALVYNEMMDALAERDRLLRNQNENLELRVQVRTKELVEARDAALAASRHKSEFLANMSHELRTPLNAVIGFAELLRDSLAGLGQSDESMDADAVYLNARSLLGMINNILDLAKIEAGRMELHIAKMKPRELGQRALRTIGPLMADGRNETQLEVVNGDSTVYMDDGKAMQILLNLLSNAAKFTSHDTVILRLSLDGNMLTMEVEDHGAGIDPDFHEQIFEQFRQADGTTTRRFEGTGLGLAITRQLCRLMGGDIHVRSEVGQGSIFTGSIQVWDRPPPKEERERRLSDLEPPK